MNRPEDPPVFGQRVAGQHYVVRPSAYTVIRNSEDQIAVVKSPLGFFLPGGGIEKGETAEQTIIREAQEECGLLIQPQRRIAAAVQLTYSSAEHTYFEKPSVFWGATVEQARIPRIELDHELLWLSADAAAASMTHESHAWALRLECTTIAG
jgi:8-oxo-dGTP diphosphatase